MPAPVRVAEAQVLFQDYLAKLRSHDIAAYDYLADNAGRHFYPPGGHDFDLDGEADPGFDRA